MGEIVFEGHRWHVFAALAIVLVLLLLLGLVVSLSLK
jgi:hypothetical protein